MKTFWKLFTLTSFLLALPTMVPANDEPDPIDHFKVLKPADLSKEEASRIYERMAQQMLEGYRQSDTPAAAQYQNWKRFNTAPYLSRGHGNRFLNNYGNSVARDYLNLQTGEQMPVGSILAKDSFTVTQSGEAFGGALFLMEKLPQATSPDTADWRYVMIMPDGSLFGDTLGENPVKMDFCHSCHEIAEAEDFLYFIPEDFQIDQ